MNRSELLQSRIIDAHEKLWARIVEISRDLPNKYRNALGLFQVLTPKEMETAKANREFQFSTTDEAFGEVLNDRNLELIRPYIDDSLWEMARGRVSFSIRLLILFSTDTPNPVELTNWPEDKLVKQHLSSAFTQQELERFNYSQPGTLKEILDLWETRIIAEIKKGLLS